MENIDKSWLPLFEQYDFNLDVFDKLCEIEYIFRVFEMPVDKIKVVFIKVEKALGANIDWTL